MLDPFHRRFLDGPAGYRKRDETIMITDLGRIRNIGVSAHIDAGKTTLTERILFYTNRIHAIHDVKGKDGVGAKMDSMELERERGITIASAATHCQWKGHTVNIIDTPGHVDFTIEVERSLRVLDGAVLVLCGVAGVQSQSITVDRQMRRYQVPRIAFVNKLDRTGASPVKVVQQLREKLGHNAVMLQIPVGREAGFEGVVDLVEMRALMFRGGAGEIVHAEEIPPDLKAEAEAAQEAMLDAVSLFSDELTEAILEERVTAGLVREAIRQGTLSLKLTPVLMGSAYKNRGVQPLLDAVNLYLPDPTQIQNDAIELSNGGGEAVSLSNSLEGPLVAFAFKLEDGRYGQLTYIRIYQGTLRRGDAICNARTEKRVKVGRLVRMHADEMEEIVDAGAGDIVALFGVDCASGDTFTSPDVHWSMTSMHVPEPVIHLSIHPIDRKAEQNMSKALQRFSKEDPTFRVRSDSESQETIISGMGELHLEVYVERMKREYKAEVTTGQPQVAYREAVTRRASFDYTHRKQTGGAGQYGRVIGYVEPFPEGEFEMVNRVKGGNVPTEYIAACEKGFRSCLGKGRLIGFPVVGLRVVLEDGNSHAVDSSDLAFQMAARRAFWQAYTKAQPMILEPIMNVAIEAPKEFQGNVIRTLMQRRGIIIGTTDDEGFSQVEAQVPLAEMFGYSTNLRSASQGKAEFTMEFEKYGPTPTEVSEALKKKFEDKIRS